MLLSSVGEFGLRQLREPECSMALQDTPALETGQGADVRSGVLHSVGGNWDEVAGLNGPEPE
jgi:hypothetical protein